MNSDKDSPSSNDSQGGAHRPGQARDESPHPGESQGRGLPEKHRTQGQGANKDPEPAQPK